MAPLINRMRLFFSRFRNRRTVVLLAVLFVLALGHGPILQLLAWPLVAPKSPETQADFYCLQGGELGADGFEPFDSAAAWCAEAPDRKILLLMPPDSRLVEIGAVRPFEWMCRGELDKRQIPASDVLAIHAESSGVWGGAHALAGWLTQHPGAKVLVACNSLNSARQHYVFDKVLGPAAAKRVILGMLPDSKYRMGNWWRSRVGVKGFMYCWLELMYAWAEGDDARPLPAGAAEFQKEIRAKIGEAPS
jgi:hypothetical protein